MRVITAGDVIPGAGRQGVRLLARRAPAALGVLPRTARTRPARRPRRHPEGADPQRVAPGCPVMPRLGGCQGWFSMAGCGNCCTAAREGARQLRPVTLRVLLVNSRVGAG